MKYETIVPQLSYINKHHNTYDDLNRMTSYTNNSMKTEYQYNALDQRVQKRGSSNNYITDAKSFIYERGNLTYDLITYGTDKSKSYIYGLRVEGEVENGEYNNYSYNGLGDTTRRGGVSNKYAYGNETVVHEGLSWSYRGYYGDNDTGFVYVTPL